MLQNILVLSALVVQIQCYYVEFPGETIFRVLPIYPYSNQKPKYAVCNSISEDPCTIKSHKPNYGTTDAPFLGEKTGVSGDLRFCKFNTLPKQYTVACNLPGKTTYHLRKGQKSSVQDDYYSVCKSEATFLNCSTREGKGYTGADLTHMYNNEYIFSKYGLGLRSHQTRDNIYFLSTNKEYPIVVNTQASSTHEDVYSDYPCEPKEVFENANLSKNETIVCTKDTFYARNTEIVFSELLNTNGKFVCENIEIEPTYIYLLAENEIYIDVSFISKSNALFAFVIITNKLKIAENAKIILDIPVIPEYGCCTDSKQSCSLNAQYFNNLIIFANIFETKKPLGIKTRGGTSILSFIDLEYPPVEQTGLFFEHGKEYYKRNDEAYLKLLCNKMLPNFVKKASIKLNKVFYCENTEKHYCYEFEAIEGNNCNASTKIMYDGNWYIKVNLVNRENFLDMPMKDLYNRTLNFTNEQILDTTDFLRRAKEKLNVIPAQTCFDEVKYMILNASDFDRDFKLFKLKHLKNQLINEEVNGTEEDASLKFTCLKLISAEISRMRNENRFILHIRTYVKYLHDKFKEAADEEERNKHLEDHQEEYDKFVDGKINEINYLLEEELMPLMDTYSTELNDSINSYIDDIKRRIRKEKDYKSELRSALDIEYKRMIAGAALEVAGTATSAVSSIPFGGLIKAALDVGVGLAKTAVPDKPVLPPIPTEIFKKQMKKIYGYIDEKLRNLMSRVDKMIFGTAGNPKLESSHSALKALKSSLLLIPNKPPMKRLKAINKERKKFMKIFFEIGQEIDRQKNMESYLLVQFSAKTKKGKKDKKGDKNSKENEGNDSNMDKAGDSYDSVSTGASGVIGAVKEYKTEQKKINGLIKKSVERQNELVRFKDYVENTLVEKLIKLVESFLVVSGEMEDSSAASIDVTQWRLVEVINEIQFELKRILQGLEGSKRMMNVFEKIKHLFDTAAKLFSKISTYQDQKVFAEFISKGFKIISSNGYGAEITQMEEMIVQAMIQKDFERAVSAFKQWSFPFASQFLEPFKHIRRAFGENIDGDLRLYEKSLNLIIDELEQYDEHITNRDEFLHTDEFYYDRKTKRRPLYTWTAQKYSHLIKDLLKGKPVSFYADVKDYMSCQKLYMHEAVRFSQIGIKFRIPKNRKLERRMEEDLKNYRITMLHLGYHHLRVQKKLFTFMSESFMLSHTFDGTGRNMASTKLEKGDSIVSPYTGWVFQLEGRHSGDQDFSEFNFDGDPCVHMDLVGNATYLLPMRGNRFHDENILNHFEDDGDIEDPECQFVMGKFMPMNANYEDDEDNEENEGDEDHEVEENNQI